MKVLYKTVMFLTLLIFCVGSVCAADPDNNTNVNSNLTDDQVINIVNTALEKKNVEIKALQDNDIKQSNEIQQLKDNNTQLDKRVKILENSSAEKDVRINELNNTVNCLKFDNEALKDNNTQLDKRVKDLEYSKLTQSNRIKSLEIDIKNLEESNKQLVDSNKDLNVKIDNQSVIINSLKTDNEALNAKLDLQVNEIKQLQADKDKLNAEIKQTYEKLLNSPKKEDFDQLKKEIDNKNKQIDKLNNEINTLRAIISVNGKDVYNSLKGLFSTKNIKCGKYSFKLEDYLKIPLIKNGKNNILKFKKTHGRLPNYVTISGYDVPKKVYQKLYNL